MSNDIKTTTEWTVTTYPCFFAKKGDEYRYLTSEGDTCFIFFSDEDIAERFYRDMFRAMYPDEKTVVVDLLAMPNRESLLGILHDMDEQGPAKGITHIAIDPTAGRVGRVTIRTFIDELEKV